MNWLVAIQLLREGVITLATFLALDERVRARGGTDPTDEEIDALDESAHVSFDSVLEAARASLKRQGADPNLIDGAD